MKKATKLEKLLIKKKMTQGELIGSIKKETGIKIGRDRISRIASGSLHNYTIETAVLIAETLGVKVDEIIDLDIKRIVDRRKKNPKKNHVFNK